MTPVSCSACFWDPEYGVKTGHYLLTRLYFKLHYGQSFYVGQKSVLLVDYLNFVFRLLQESRIWWKKSGQHFLTRLYFSMASHFVIAKNHGLDATWFCSIIQSAILWNHWISFLKSINFDKIILLFCLVIRIQNLAAVRKLVIIFACCCWKHAILNCIVALWAKVHENFTVQ